MTTVPAVPPVPKCPECGVQLVLVNNLLPDECAACHFTLDGWEPFLRWFKLAKKLTEPETIAPAVPAKRKSILGNLSRR